jgi:hypothetical protein
MDQEVRGIPLWLIREYLEELGGTAQDDFHVTGDGWTARLEQIEDFQVGSLVVGQVRIVLDGAIDEMSVGLDEKLLRAGG